jgi:D-alanine-D-alanine ligase
MAQVSSRRVLVLCGGRSAEHEISLLSARFVREALEAAGYEVLLVGIDRSGQWRLEPARALREVPADPRLLKHGAGGPEVLLAPCPTPQPELRVHGSPPLSFDVVFPVLHGPYGEDGTLQGLLELAGVPYVGSGVVGSAVGMDKDVMKRLLEQAGIPILPYVALRQQQYRAAPESALENAQPLGLPLFVKPANLGSSLGVTRVLRAEDLQAAVERAFEYDEKLVIERGLDHPREIECAVLSGPNGVLVSVPGEIRVTHPDGFYSYAAKYLGDSGVELLTPASLSELEIERAKELARRAFEVLEAQGLARVDLFLDGERRLWVNEINTLPGFTAVSMYPKLIQASGVEPAELMRRLIDDALERHRRRRASSLRNG